MLPKSAKEKGKRYERHIVEVIRGIGLDINAGREIGSGSGRAKGDIRTTIPFLIEAKNQAVVNILQWIDQAREQTQKGFAWKDRWCLVFRDPREPESKSVDYAVIDFYEFAELLKKLKSPQVENPDKGFTYALSFLRKAIKETEKYLK